MTTTKRHLPGLDHLRALAICMVMLRHSHHFAHPAWIDDFGKFGFTGVDLFFVLSGFLIAGGLFVEMKAASLIRWRRFAIRRAFRILPAYLIVVAVYFLWPVCRERDGIRPLWRFLTFTQNFDLDLARGATFSHAWSLCVEEHFYLVFPVVLSLAKTRLRTLAYALPVLVVGGMLTRWFFWQTDVAHWVGTPGENAAWYKALYYPTYQRLDGLVIGVGLAAFMAFVPRAHDLVRRWSFAFVVIAVLLLSAAWWITQDMQSLVASVVEFPLIAAGYGFLVAAASTWTTSSHVTDIMAKLSFSTYLLHKAVFHVMQMFAEDPTSNLTFVVCIATSFALSALMYLVVKKAALAFGRRIAAAVDSKKETDRTSVFGVTGAA